MSDYYDSLDQRHDPLWQEVMALIARADPVPERIYQMGRNSFTWRTIDAELAELAFDSVRALPVGVRGLQGPRRLTFEAPDLTLHVRLTGPRGRRQLTGLLDPPQQASIVVRHAGGIAAARADAFGRFVVEDLAAGPATLRCHLADRRGDRPVVTDWVNL